MRDVALGMDALAALQDGADAKAKLMPLVDQYREWIHGQQSLVPDTPAKRQATGRGLLNRAGVAADRIARGINLLAKPDCLKAFQIANRAMATAARRRFGPMQGKKLESMAGARTVVSTLWSIDDTSSLFLMKQFYRHIAAHEPPSIALVAAKRDMLRKYGAAAVPYYWAAYTVEGAASLGATNHE